MANDMLKTKRIKMMAGVLGVSLFVLAVDRMSQGPADAEATDTPVADTAQVDAPVSATIEPAVPTIQRRPVSELLSRYANDLPSDMSRMPDALAPSPEWIAPEIISKVQTSANDTDAMKGKQFARTHTVTAVMTIGDGGFAIVNQQIVRPGDTVSGFTLISVQRDRAVFRSGQTEVFLEVHVPSR